MRNKSAPSWLWHVPDYSHSGRVPAPLPAQEVWIFAFWCLFAKYNLLPCQFTLIRAHYKGLSTPRVLAALVLLMQNTVPHETHAKPNKETPYAQDGRTHVSRWLSPLNLATRGLGPTMCQGASLSANLLGNIESTIFNDPSYLCGYFYM